MTADSKYSGWLKPVLIAVLFLASISEGAEPDPFNPNDYYARLGVSRTATAEQIKKAFKRLSREYHPDTSGLDGEAFKKIQEAWDTFSDNEKKANYDERFRNPIHPEETQDGPEEIVRPGSGFDYQIIMAYEEIKHRPEIIAQINREMFSVIREIRKRFPVKEYYVVGVGRSASPFVAMMNSFDPGSAGNLPFSDGATHSAIGYNAKERQIQRFQDEMLRNLFPFHAERFLPRDEQLAGRKVLVFDFSNTGNTMNKIRDLFLHYSKQRPALNPEFLAIEYGSPTARPLFTGSLSGMDLQANNGFVRSLFNGNLLGRWKVIYLDDYKALAWAVKNFAFKPFAEYQRAPHFGTTFGIFEFWKAHEQGKDTTALFEAAKSKLVSDPYDRNPKYSEYERTVRNQFGINANSTCAETFVNLLKSTDLRTMGQSLGQK